MIQTIAKRFQAIACLVVKHIKEVTRPVNSYLVSDLAIDLTRSKRELILENSLLCQQLIVLRRQWRPRLSNLDRIKLVFLAKLAPNWKSALYIVQPDTLPRWHRDLFRIVWHRKSRSMSRKRRISPETIDLIQQMAAENLTWGAKRIHGELLKLSIRISKRTVQKCLRRFRTPAPSGQTWATFLRNHASGIWACDFVQTYDLFFRSIFVFVIIEHSSRRIVHVAITYHPTDAWVAQQLRKATPWNQKPSFLIRDNDCKYGQGFSAVAKATGIKEVAASIEVPNMNASCGRFAGTLRRECLDHILFLNQKHLDRVTRDFVQFYNTARLHQGISQRIPISPHVQPTSGRVFKMPLLGGLHHDYRHAT